MLDARENAITAAKKANAAATAQEVQQQQQMAQKSLELIAKQQETLAANPDKEK